jgi:hypothetical protein
MNIAPIVTALCAAGVISAQGGLRGSATAASGGTITVQVGTSDSTVEVSAAGSANVQSHDVGPDRTATFPVPRVPPGTILFVTVGRGLRIRVIAIEVVDP